MLWQRNVRVSIGRTSGVQCSDQINSGCNGEVFKCDTGTPHVILGLLFSEQRRWTCRNIVVRSHYLTMCQDSSKSKAQTFAVSVSVLEHFNSQWRQRFGILDPHSARHRIYKTTWIFEKEDKGLVMVSMYAVFKRSRMIHECSRNFDVCMMTTRERVLHSHQFGYIRSISGPVSCCKTLASQSNYDRAC
jgi:hypothetical protein